MCLDHEVSIGSILAGLYYTYVLLNYTLGVFFYLSSLLLAIFYMRCLQGSYIFHDFIQLGLKQHK
jgi:hypothetical protein